jgi:hypothetical protein
VTLLLEWLRGHALKSGSHTKIRNLKAAIRCCRAAVSVMPMLSATSTMDPLPSLGLPSPCNRQVRSVEDIQTIRKFDLDEPNQRGAAMRPLRWAANKDARHPRAAMVNEERGGDVHIVDEHYRSGREP